MKITSEAFIDGALLPKQFTCDGAGTNPPLTFSDIPADTKSLTLIYEDPDAPKSSYAPDGIWVHWLVWNIDPSKSSITSGEKNFGVVGRNSGGDNDFGSPCPPRGEHRYIFMLYALDAVLDLSAGADKAELMSVMRGHILAEASLWGRYSR